MDPLILDPSPTGYGRSRSAHAEPYLAPVEPRLHHPAPFPLTELQSDPVGFANEISDLLALQQEEVVAAADYGERDQDPDRPLMIYPYGVSRYHLEQVIQTLKLKATTTKDLDSADVVLALRDQVRHRSKIQQLAHSRQIPIHLVKANTLIYISRALRQVLHLQEEEGLETELDVFMQASAGDETEALEEARLAVEQIVIPKSQPVELLPRPAIIRKLQHELVEYYHLRADSFGEEPNRRLRIYPN
jgi:hypothetical protein